MIVKGNINLSESLPAGSGSDDISEGEEINETEQEIYRRLADPHVDKSSYKKVGAYLRTGKLFNRNGYVLRINADGMVDGTTDRNSPFGEVLRFFFRLFRAAVLINFLFCFHFVFYFNRLRAVDLHKERLNYEYASCESSQSLLKVRKLKVFHSGFVIHSTVGIPFSWNRFSNDTGHCKSEIFVDRRQGTSPRSCKYWTLY